MLQVEVKKLLERTRNEVFISYRLPRSVPGPPRPKPRKLLDRTLLLALLDKLNQAASSVRSTEFNRQCLLVTDSIRTLYRESSTKRVSIALDVPIQTSFVRPRSDTFAITFRAGNLKYGSGDQPKSLWRESKSFRRIPIRIWDLEPRYDLQRIGPLIVSQRQHEFEVEQLAFLDYFSTLVDKFADYWRRIVDARETFKDFSVRTRLHQRVKSALKFKPLHTPVQIVPRSIHPIESAV